MNIQSSDDTIVQKYEFTINLSGENSINIHSLSKILENLDILTKEASQNIANCEFNILAVNKGSFELLFEGIAVTAANLLTQDNINYISTCLKSINEWFAIKKHLGSGSPKGLEKDEREITVTNESGEIQVFSASGAKFFENAKICNSIINIGTTLKESNREQMRILGNDVTPEKIMEISAEDYDELSAPIDLRNENTVYISHINTDLLLVTAVFNGDAQWGFYFNKNIKAKIEDEIWLNSFRESKIPLTYGTQMKVAMRMETLKDNYGNPIENTAKYYIEKVISVVKPFDDSVQLKF